MCGDFMKLKSFSLLSFIFGIILLYVGAGAPFIVSFSNNSAFGVIGGADTPTYEFLLSYLFEGLLIWLICLGICLIITAVFCLIFAKTVEACCSIKTSLISYALSVVGAAGLGVAFLCYGIAAFHEISMHPVTYPVSYFLGILCLYAFVILILIYCRFRRRHWSVKGFIIDILTSILYLPSFFCFFCYLYRILSK